MSVGAEFAEFTGLRVLVTGGASGIGLAIADFLAARGAVTTVLDRDVPALPGAQDGGVGGDRPERQQQDDRPRVSVGEAVQRASSGRPGRFLGASNRGDTIVVRWEYPGGRVADIMVDARTGRVVGER